MIWIVLASYLTVAMACFPGSYRATVRAWRDDLPSTVGERPLRSSDQVIVLVLGTLTALLWPIRAIGWLVWVMAGRP